MRTELRAVAEPAGTRTEYWRDTVSGLFAGLELEFHAMPDRRDALVYGAVGPLSVIESRSGPGEARRTIRHIRRHDTQRYMVFVQLQGTAVGDHNGRTERFEPGDVGVIDLARPLHCVYTERRAVMVSYPKELSPLRPHEVARLAGTRIAGTDGAIALVAKLVDALPNHLDADDGTGGARIGTAVLDLVNAGLAARLDRTSSLAPEVRDRTLLLRCRRHIEDHLGDLHLSPRSIAEAHHVSVRQLQRLFGASEHGVAGWIRRRRLERCRRDLLDPALASRPATAIGARWGFTDAAHFSRVFKGAYGLPPGEFRRTFAS